MRRGGDLLRAMVALRWLSLVAVVGALSGAVLMLAIGAVTVYDAVRLYFGEHPGPGKGAEADEAVVELVGALDELLFGLLLLVFAFGVVQLFLLSGEAVERLQGLGLPRWLQLRELLELKIMLVELVVVLLIVQFFKFVLAEATELAWELLVVPVAVGIFGAVVWLLRSCEQRDEST